MDQDRLTLAVGDVTNSAFVATGLAGVVLSDRRALLAIRAALKGGMTVNNFITVKDAVDGALAQPDPAEQLAEALRQFAECDLNESNCASFEVANRRIRAIARAALDEYEGK